MLEANIEIKVNKEATDEILKKADEGLDDLADFIFARSQELVPVDEAMLKKSGNVERLPLNKTICYDAPHAIFIEAGTDPHMPPVRPLQEWARRHGMKDYERAGWAIAKKIEKEGTKPQPFLRPAVDEGSARAKEIIGRRMK
uniref:HK97 gp10 family phage protein n=1 Tax=viral metagenome TaxID=1070528 RepID=A0A6M3XR70_9ZZZZ